MADFIAVIRRAVDGLSNNTPEMRARVYEKARSAVVRQLENMSPRPPEHMLQRQLEKLDAAIREVEAEHAEALPALDEVAVPAFEPQAAQAPEPHAAHEPQPVWAEPARGPEPLFADPGTAAHASPEPEQTVPEAAVEHDYAAVEHTEYREPEAPAVTGDDWADAHMSEPAPASASEVYASEAEVVAEEPRPAAAAEPAPSVWSDPDYALTGGETDYANMYDAKVFGDAQARDAAPAAESRLEAAFSAAEERRIEASPVTPAEPAFTGWANAPEPEFAADRPVAPAWGEVADRDQAAETGDSLIEPADFAAPAEEPRPAVSDAVDDWLQSRASDPTPAIPAASWDLPLGIAPAANRVPELPEIEPAPVSISHTPTDEFPAYQEPVHVEVEQDFPVPAGLSLEQSQPEPFETVAAAPAVAQAAATIDPDDFSQWFRDNAEVQASVATAAPGTSELPATPDWDAHLQSFSPDAKPATIDQDSDIGRMMGGYDQPAYRLEPKKRRNLAPIVLGVVGLLVIAGVGYAGWTWRDDIGSMVANLTGAPEKATEGETTPAATSPAATDAAPAATAPTTPTPTPAATATAPEDGAASGQKFTQRLRADGSEIDEGAGAAPAGTAEEGRSVSAQTVASTIEPTDAPASATPTAGTAPTNAASSAAPVAGGEKLFLYEERLGQATPVAVPGSIIWSAVRETGPDGKPDPQIQGKLNVPERGISALVTIKRNTDNSLPASHLIEVVFSVPADFEGGAIDNLQRIAMKRTEQDRGDPLVAVTAKVTDDTYLVALNDFADVIKRNMELLSTRGWIDIPVTYRNGRRALLTFDKGTQGAKVFEQVMREWAALAPPAAAN
ncbi:hypothetical protein [Rhizobium glycinendophyticum]|uniref:Uncharacterized protein n=1 Tax=Rhizobium glycinendophyticum TaxID=2589807 RepID=A0A504UFN8_9HYPH|nr:hypothetical protein [Rhizobium glycinendophyticum]TPP11870.1 hypothetical protein FJQ55_14060 [Rhizobium glycinendophyticum]